MTVSEHPDVVLPAAMIEAAARALYDHDRVPDHEDFDELQEWDQDSYRDAVKAVLAASLGVCEVREDWGCRYHDLHAEDGLPVDVTWWHPRGIRREVEDFADSKPWGFHARVIRRLSITTPAEPVDTEGAAT